MRLIKYLLSIGCIFQLFGCNSRKVIVRTQQELTVVVPSTSFFDFKMTSIDGKETIDFAQYKGKKIVVLNVASKCGYTDQYADWEKFYELHNDKVVILGFPSNEFLWQEKGSNSEIAKFCKLNYGVTFPMFQKTTVKGSDKCSLYKWLTTPTLNGWNKKEPSWNFCKYLIDENGQLLAFFSSKIKPTDDVFLNQIKL